MRLGFAVSQCFIFASGPPKTNGASRTIMLDLSGFTVFANHRFLGSSVRSQMSRLKLNYLGLLTILQILGSSPAPGQDGRMAEERIIQTGKLSRFDPLSPKDALQAFEVAPGFRIELVAAEPLVVDPIAFCFDPKGRLIVVEMRGYSERADSKTGRVRRLTDRDHDGKMDEAETLLDGLEWPTAVACWDNGILIGVAPDILFLPLSEDGMHGPPESLFSGFGKSNVQGLFNSFQWGPDLKLHGATSSSGAKVTGDTVDGEIRLSRRDFAIDFHTRKLTPVVGGAQHGMTFDRWGKQVCLQQ